MTPADAFRTTWTSALGVRVALWSKLPLAAFAGLRVLRLDEAGAEVKLPAGWKTQNPFGSTYFAAQAMAAELSTGVAALWFIEQSGARVSSLVTGLSAQFTKKATKETRFVFDGGPAMKAAIARAVETGQPVVFQARSVGTQVDGTKVAAFTIDWSFKVKR